MFKKKSTSFLFLLHFLLIIFSTGLHTKSIVLFSPDDRPTTKLINLIHSAKHKIHAAVYMITDKNIAQALIKAQQERKIDVQIITDKITMESSFGKGKFLKENGVSIQVLYAPPTKNLKKSAVKDSTKEPAKDTFFKAEPIMHHKFALIDNTLWTGSFNWTKSANQKNQENVLITDNKEIYERYQAQFEHLKTQCIQEPIMKQDQETAGQKISNALKKFLQILKEYTQ